MILVTLEKDEQVGKMRVKSWEWISKMTTKEIVIIPGVKEVISDENVPQEFYESCTKYYVEANQLRRLML